MGKSLWRLAIQEQACYGNVVVYGPEGKSWTFHQDYEHELAEILKIVRKREARDGE